MKKLSQLILTVSILSMSLSVSGCGNEEPITKIDEANTKVTAFRGGRYIRVNIDGVDCIVGVGNFDTTVAVTCDWNSKKDRQLK